jgi:hypothetical protein
MFLSLHTLGRPGHLSLTTQLALHILQRMSSYASCFCCGGQPGYAIVSWQMRPHTRPAFHPQPLTATRQHTNLTVANRERPDRCTKECWCQAAVVFWVMACHTLYQATTFGQRRTSANTTVAEL